MSRRGHRHERETRRPTALAVEGVSHATPQLEIAVREVRTVTGLMDGSDDQNGNRGSRVAGAGEGRCRRLNWPDLDRSPGMAIKGNVILCDECGRQISMPMELVPGGKQSLDERVRAYAIEKGWIYTDQRHICPEHKSAV